MSERKFYLLYLLYFTHSLTRIHWFCNWKSIISEWSFFLKSKSFPFSLAIKEIPTLKSLYKLFLIKLSANISDSSFVLDSLLKAKISPDFSAGNSFLFFKRYWNLSLSDRCHFVVSLPAWKKPKQLFSIFLFYSIKISVFDKMEKFMWINFNCSCA